MSERSRDMSEVTEDCRISCIACAQLYIRIILRNENVLKEHTCKYLTANIVSRRHNVF